MSYKKRGSDSRGSKRSGAKTGTYKAKSNVIAGFKKGDAVPFVRGWRANKRDGVITYFAQPYSKTKRVRSKDSGKLWENWMVTIQRTGYKDQIVSGMYEVPTQRVIIGELSLVMNPRGGPGGYTGRNYYVKNR